MPTVAEKIRIAEQEEQKRLKALAKKRPGMTLRTQLKKPSPQMPGLLREEAGAYPAPVRKVLRKRDIRERGGAILPESLHRFTETIGLPAEQQQMVDEATVLRKLPPSEPQISPSKRQQLINQQGEFGTSLSLQRQQRPQGGQDGYTYVGSAEQQGGLPLTAVPPKGASTQQLRTDNMGAITEQDVGQYLAQNPLSEDPRAPVNLSDANFQQTGLYDQNAYLQQQAGRGDREIIDPMQIETGYDPSNLPGGIFGAQLGYLKAAQSLIGPAAMGKARKRQGAIALQQQKASAAQRKEARNYDLNLNRHLLDRFKAQQPVLRMQKEYDEYGGVVGEAPVWHKRPTNQELDNQANQQQARQQLIKRAHARATAAIKKGIDPAAIDAELERMGFPPLGGGEGGGGGGGGQQLQTTAPPLSIRQQRGGMPINSELSQANRPSPEQVDEMVQGLLYQSPALERQQGAMVRSQTPLIPKEMLKLLKARKLSDIAREERELLNIKPRGTR